MSNKCLSPGNQKTMEHLYKWFYMEVRAGKIIYTMHGIRVIFQKKTCVMSARYPMPWTIPFLGIYHDIPFMIELDWRWFPALGLPVGLPHFGKGLVQGWDTDGSTWWDDHILWKDD
jgi:hypothetical protein